jgi:hypothetical protein
MSLAAREMTFQEIVDAARAKLGHWVSVRIFDERGRVMHMGRGELMPGRLDATEAAMEDSGAVVFRVVPGPSFQLHPQIVSDGQEEDEAKELRVELVNGGAIVIETLSTRRGPRAPELKMPPSQKELRKAAGRAGRERARYEARERARRDARNGRVAGQ